MIVYTSTSPFLVAEHTKKPSLPPFRAGKMLSNFLLASIIVFTSPVVNSNATIEPLIYPTYSTDNFQASPQSAINLQELPDLGGVHSAYITAAQEQALGQTLLGQVRQQLPLANDPILNDYIQQLSFRLSSYSELKNTQLTVLLVDKPSINAFAMPGNVLGLNVGILLNSQSEDEIAAVIAHEIAHLSQKHFIRNLNAAKAGQKTALATLIASAILAASTGIANPGVVALVTTTAAQQQTRLRFSREFEQEADRIGIKNLSIANYDPKAMPRFFERLLQSNKSSDIIPEFLMTHPATTSRISDSFNHALLQKNSENPYRYGRQTLLQGSSPKNFLSLDSTLLFLMMKYRTQAIYGQTSLAGKVDYFKHLTTHSKTKTQRLAARYGLCVALQQDNRFQESLDHLQKLKQALPNTLLLQITEIEILINSEKYTAADARVKQYLNISPENQQLKRLQARALLQLGQAKKAESLLKDILRKDKNNIEDWKLLLQAHYRLGNNRDIFETKAELFFLKNQFQQGVQQLELALKKPQNSLQQRARIIAKIKEAKRKKSLKFTF